MIFLIVLGLVWLIAAAICDLKKREVPNWLNFSLLLFALAYRAFYSIFANNADVFLFGLLGVGVFFVLAHIFYYGKIFAGGDAKLLISLGAVIPLADTLKNNLILLLGFVFLLLLVGAVYGLGFSFFLVSKNKKPFLKEYKKQFKKIKKDSYLALGLAIILLFAVFSDYLVLSVLALLICISPCLFIYATAVEETCMIKKVSVRNLSEGDWLYKEIKVNDKKIKPSWQGLTIQDIRLIQKNFKTKKILIKQGIPFVPVFLIAYIIFLMSEIQTIYFSMWY